MRVVIAMDSFKGSMSSAAAGAAVAYGIMRACPDADTVVSPLADGGEGTAEVIIAANGGVTRTVRVCDPLGRPIDAQYGIIRDTGTAVIEMASAAGITLISDAERNPMHTTTYGVGEMIRDAINEGCRKFVVGIGGSATNDGGVGMLTALGYRFFDRSGNDVVHGAAGLGEISAVNVDHAMPELRECVFSIACDVGNPLCGANGCSAIYGPQKGADDEMIAEMDAAMARFEQITRTVYPDANGEIAGSGAAGGLGFAFMSYLGATLRSGIELVIAETGLEEHIKNADIVVTGEGRLDGQSIMGKTPIGVAHVAKKYQKPVIAFAGSITPDANKCNHHGIDAFFPIVKSPCTLEQAMDSNTARQNLSDMAEQVFRVVDKITVM